MSKDIAARKTEDAEKRLTALADILVDSLSASHEVNWDDLSKLESYREEKPVRTILPVVQKQTLSAKPNFSDDQFKVDIGLLDAVLVFPRINKIKEKRAWFEASVAEWDLEVSRINSRHEELTRRSNKRQEEEDEKFNIALNEYNSRKELYDRECEGFNLTINAKKIAYKSGDKDAILYYCDLVLNASKYPECIKLNFDVDYNKESRLLFVDCKLPLIDDLPSVKSYRYVASRNAFDEQQLSNSEKEKLYDGILFKIALRTINELFDADVAEVIDAIVFNGVVQYIDRAVGRDVSACILSIMVGKDEFSGINLALVDPKTCFKALKGISGVKLVGLTPVAPIAVMDKKDRRFVQAYDVVDDLDSSANLAEMHWEDFEHLIREIFQKEFSISGGEVKITQASRDGGVDAVAFDPDPIRGGKIVIQAKRYTNTVGVTAVRDLYGTVMSEGANKGILVTTSNFGSDSYQFAKDKPIVLLNGSNLLHLLEKHGYKARIDLKEAKRNFN